MAQCRSWLQKENHQCPATAVTEDLCPLHNGMADQEPKHWYCFVFIGKRVASTSIENVFEGYETNKLTLRRIEEAAVTARLSEAVLFSWSYLGEMTEAEFKGE